MSTEEIAQRIWDNAGPLKGPVAETYYAGTRACPPEDRTVCGLWLRCSTRAA